MNDNVLDELITKRATVRLKDDMEEWVRQMENNPLLKNLVINPESNKPVRFFVWNIQNDGTKNSDLLGKLDVCETSSIFRVYDSQGASGSSDISYIAEHCTNLKQIKRVLLEKYKLQEKAKVQRAISKIISDEERKDE